MTSTDLVLDVVAEVAGDITIADAIVAGELERTIEGASTLTIDVHDPHRLLIRSPNLSRAIDLQYADVWFRLVKIAKAGDTVSLTFEDRDVAYLRTHRKSRKVSRNTMTRAQFVRSLVREVREHKIKFFSPEVNERQPIGKTKSEATPTKRTEKDRTENRAQGISADAVCKVQGQRWVSKQRANAERVLDVANTLGAGPKATKALVLACITESGMFNLTWGDRDSQGILQVRVSTSGSAARSRDIEWCCRVFLTKGFWGKGGAIDIAASRSSLTAGEVAQQVQGSAFGSRYDYYDAEADAIIEAYGGASGTDTGGTTTTETTVRKKYEFARGLPGQPEDSWTAIQRLATEVRWRAFMDAGTLYFVSEERLLKARARYVISEDDDGINSIDFDIDQGKVSGEVRVSLRTELYDVPVGSVLAIREMGICNGRWLVATVRQSLFENDVELVLKALTPKLPEPAAETKTTTSTSGGGGGTAKGAIPGSPVPGQPPHASTHQTDGLPGYPAYDYMAPAGTACVAPVDGTIERLSGKNPSLGGPAGGALGYSIYLTGANDKSYFLTHLDKVRVKAGQRVDQGEQMAVVAKGPPSWSTPHVHMGVKG